MNVYLKKLKDSRGGASIVEYTIVLPLCLFVVMFLFFAAYFLNERAVLDAAAHRSVLVAQKLYTDPKFISMADLSYTDDVDYVGYKRNGNTLQDAAEVNKPYRFVFGTADFNATVKEAVKKKAESCVRTNQLFPLWESYIGDVEVSEPVVDGLIVKNVTVTVSESYEFPAFMQMIGLQGEYVMQGAATTSLSAEPELIRNIDLATQLLDRLDGGEDYMDKIKETLKKIGNFVTSLGEGD